MLDRILEERGVPALRSREEMLELLLKYEYGRMPSAPDRVTFTVEEDISRNFCAGKAKMNKITVTAEFDGRVFSFPFHSVIPVSEGKHPFFVSIGFDFERTIPNKYLPVEELIDSGFAVLHLFYGDVTSDDADFGSGMAGVIYRGEPRGAEDPGKIAMWAWASQRMLDYAYTNSALDTERAVVCGHSRLGKTALLAGATDTRFKYVYSNDSGCSGAAISRGKVGESTELINKVFGYWFCENYKEFSGRENELPFDQHYLIASIAPRYAYVASASRDTWADPDSELLACCASSGAWGADGLICEDRLPRVGDVYHGGHVGYHLRAGEHYFSREDWNTFIAFYRAKEGLI